MVLQIGVGWAGLVLSPEILGPAELWAFITCPIRRLCVALMLFTKLSLEVNSWGSACHWL